MEKKLHEKELTLFGFATQRLNRIHFLEIEPISFRATEIQSVSYAGLIYADECALLAKFLRDLSRASSSDH